MSRQYPMRHTGFTLVELIVVIVLIGIVALIAAPRFFSQPTFDAARFHDESISAVRYGQKVAVAQRTNVYVVTSASSVALCYDMACSTTVRKPADSAAFVVNAPNNITLTGASFSFTSLGQPIPDVQTILRISGDGTSRRIVVVRETGYVHK